MSCLTISPADILIVVLILHPYLVSRPAEIHMKYKLRMTPDQVIQNAVNAVKHLRSLGCNDIEFSPEDAGGYC